MGTGVHAADLQLLEACRIRAVINLAPDYCRDPQWEYSTRGIAYLELECRDERNFPLISKFHAPVAAFIKAALERCECVLIHSRDGVNRAPALAVAFLLVRDQRGLLATVAAMASARPGILTSDTFQHQLVRLAEEHALLHDELRPGETVDLGAEARGRRPP